MSNLWITNSNLGSINVGESSNFKIEANFPQDSTILYSTTDSLPPGLTLEINGNITGIVTQVEEYNTGITTIDGGNTLFDNNNTNYDHTYTFSVTAEGITSGTKIQQDFTIQVNSVVYINIFGQAFLLPDQRSMWNNFINDTQIFSPNQIYKVSDKNFGIQKSLNLLVHAGIKQEPIEKFISAIGLYHKRKRFYFGDIKFAQAITPGTRNIEYEVVYVEVKDTLEENENFLPDKLKYNFNDNPLVNADNNDDIFWTRKTNELTELNPYNTRPEYQLDAGKTSHLVSDPDPSLYYVNSISHWKNQFINWKDDYNNSFLIEHNCLPLWMRSIQLSNYQELGYIPAIVLCYCNSGAAKRIISNIKNSGFNFNNLDFTIDRYVVVDKYIHFRHDQIVLCIH